MGMPDLMSISQHSPEVLQEKHCYKRKWYASQTFGHLVHMPQIALPIFVYIDTISAKSPKAHLMDFHGLII